jgi:hypothetical protein
VGAQQLEVQVDVVDFRLKKVKSIKLVANKNK